MKIFLFLNLLLCSFQHLFATSSDSINPDSFLLFDGETEQQIIEEVLAKECNIDPSYLQTDIKIFESCAAGGSLKINRKSFFGYRLITSRMNQIVIVMQPDQACIQIVNERPVKRHLFTYVAKKVQRAKYRDGALEIIEDIFISKKT